MYFPNYKRCILNLMGSIVSGFGGKIGYEPVDLLDSGEVKEAKNVILIVFDGLGYEYLTKYGESSELIKHLRGELTSLFPAATTSCIPGFMTGLSAQEHGMAGWYTFLKEIGMIIVPLRFMTRFGDFKLEEKIFRRIFNTKPISEKIKAKCYVINPEEFYDSTFCKSSAGKSKLIGYKLIKNMFGKIKNISKKGGKKYVYAYSSYPDVLMHQFGVESKEVYRGFRRIDVAFKKFLKTMKGTNSLIIVTADHGLITTPTKKRIDTKKFPKLANFLRMPLCGEGRMAYAYVKPGKKEEFERFVKGEMKQCCELMKSEDAIKKGLFGRGKIHPEFRPRIGDYLLIAKDNYSIGDYMLDSEGSKHLGNHGGTSREEMFVPLCVVKT